MRMQPSIILVRPQMGENIGAAARAMANFGLGDLRLVAPRDGWPNPKASDMAGKALNIIDDAAVYETANASVADRQFVLATTSRARAMSLPVLEVRAAMAELHKRAARGERCAVMFGPERTGLENEEVMLADAVVTIPVAPEYPSLNLAQAVVVVAYEWHQAVVGCQLPVVSEGGAAGPPLPRGEVGFPPHHFSSLDVSNDVQTSQRSGGVGNPGEGVFASDESRPHPKNARISSPLCCEEPRHFSTSPDGRGAQAAPPALRQHLTGLFDQLEGALDDVNFWRVPEKKEIMWRNIRASLIRAGLSDQEIATWRGMIKAMHGDG